MREFLQDQAKQLILQYPKLILSFTTGVGKSLAALKSIKELGGKWYIIVSEIAHIKNWHDEIVKHGYEDLFFNIEIFCYDSLHKYQFTKVKGMVWDEAHHSQSPTYVPKLQSISTEYILGLTATLPSETKTLLNYNFGDFYEYKYTLSQAIKDKVLPEPKIFIVETLLSDNPTIYIITKGLKAKRSIIECNISDIGKLLSSYNHVELRVHCTEKEKYKLITDEVNFNKEYYLTRYNEVVDSFKELEDKALIIQDVNQRADRIEYLEKEKLKRLRTIDFFKNKWLQSGNVRKRYIADLKTESARIILEKIRDKKLICFTGTIDQANKLAFSPSLVVNSYKNKVENSKILSNFNDGNIRALFATGMLTEGVNLNGIEACLIIQLDNQSKSMIQRVGRGMRSDSPLIYILYIKDTQDEKYLKTAFAGFNKDYLYYTNINEK